MQLRQAHFFLVHEVCIYACFHSNNSYTFGFSKGLLCVLSTPKMNHKHSVSMAMTLPILNNYCTTVGVISQNEDCKQVAEVWQFGTGGELTIWRTCMQVPG